MSRTAIVLSDTHLGTARSDPQGLRAFLESLEPRASRLRLILNGDIVDLWRASDKEAAEAAAPAFEALSTLMDDGAIVDWVIGNHDHHLLRSLDGEGSPVLDALPRGVRFHHPHRRLVQKRRVFLITHGDVYDFLYLPLETFGPLSWTLDPRDVYGFYDWIYDLDKELVSAFDRTGTRGLLLAWLADRWGNVWEALDSLADRDAARGVATAPARAAIASATAKAFSFDPVKLVDAAARLDLYEIWERTATVLRWRRMRYVSPHPTRVGRRRFSGRHEIVCGHFHDPRRDWSDDWAVTDDGAWWDGPGRGGTYVEIADGVATLKRFAP